MWHDGARMTETTAAADRPPRWTRWLPHLAAVWLLGIALRPVADSDVPMHAAVGRWMIDHRALLPTPDPLVWTDQGGDRQHEWLAQLLIGAVADAGGLGSLRFLLATLALACAAVLVRAVRARGGGDAAAAWAVAALAAAVGPSLAMRPHVFGWLGALAVVGIGLPGNHPWRLRQSAGWFAATALWANLHSSAVIAPVYAALGLLGALIDRKDWRAPAVREGWLRLAVVAAGACCQPMGWGIVGYALRSQAINGGLSDEWAPLLRGDVLANQPWPLAVWSALVLAACLALRRPFAWADALPAVFALCHAAATRRMVVFLFVPLLWLAGQWRALSRPLPALGVAGAAALAGVTAVAAALQLPAVDARAYPIKAAAFLQRTGLQGHLFNPDPWGGFLLWRLHPPQQVFLDGRWLLAGEPTVRDGIELQVRRADIAPLLRRYAIELLLQRRSDYLEVPPPDPAQTALAWQDPQAVVLLVRGDHFDRNLQAVCQFYGQFAALHPHARWPHRARGSAGRATPTDVPSALDLCNDATGAMAPLQKSGSAK